MIEFIIGGAGTGKFSLIKERILSDLASGKKAMLIVPEQAALSSEGAVCLEAQERGIGTAELEVLNFSRLCNRAFRLYGGISYSSVTPGAKALIMWDALFSSAPYLSHYKGELENADRFVASLTSLVSEFKAYGITPSMLSGAAEESLSDNEKLSRKLTELSVIYSKYCELLSTNRDDPSDDLTKLAELLKAKKMFEGMNVYIHSFKGFTPQQYAVIRHIFRQADNVTVTLCMREDVNSYAFESVKETKRTLLSLLDKEPVITLTKCTDRSEEIFFIEKNIWNYNDEAIFYASTDNIRTVTAENPYDEAEFVASDILSRIRKGARYRDFAVIARDIERYNGIVDAVFEKYGLPCRVFERIELSEKPIFKLILSALNIRTGGWSADDIMVYLKTGLTEITPDECDRLENYVFTWNIRGSQWRSENGWFMNPDGYSDKLTDSGRKLLDEVNDIRIRIVRPLEKLHECLSGEYTVSEICRQIYAFLNDIGVEKKIEAEADDDGIRLWNCLCDALDTLDETIGHRKADAKLFTGLFTAVVNECSVGALPSTIDEIAIGSASLIRADGVKHAYILGVNESIFPQSTSENSFFSDSEKVYLETCGVSLSPCGESLFNEELYHFYTAATLPKESATFVSSTSDTDGGSLRPSMALARVSHLFPCCRHEDTRLRPKDALISTPKQAFEYIYLLSGSEEGEALRKAYEAVTERALPSEDEIQPLTVTSEKLSRDETEDLFKDEIYLTQSRLDKFVLCAFSYQCAYSLKLKESKKAEFNTADTGNLIHRVLEKFFAGILSDGKIPTITDDELDTKITEILDDYLGGIFGGSRDVTVTKRSLQLFIRLKRTLKVLIRNLLSEFEESEFVPAFFEMEIDRSGKEGTVAPLEITLPDGTVACIHGKADRVDVCKRNGDVYVRVVDYKTGKKEFSLSDIALGLNLQMLIYLFSIWKDGSGTFRRALDIDGDIIPTGVLYLKSKISGVKTAPDASEKEIYELAEKSLTRNGLLINDEEILRLMEKRLEGKYIPVTVSKKNELTSPKGLSLQSLSELGELMDSIIETVRRLADEMKQGKADCVPLKNKNNNSCSYCPYSAICRNPAAFSNMEGGNGYGS